MLRSRHPHIQQRKTDDSKMRAFQKSRVKEELATGLYSDLTEKDVFDKTVPVATTLLLAAATESMAVVHEAMNLVCATPDVDFKEVLEQHEDASGELLEKEDDFIPADPPYNI